MNLYNCRLYSYFGRNVVFLPLLLLLLFFFWHAAETSAAHTLSNGRTCPTPTHGYYDSSISVVSNFLVSGGGVGQQDVTWTASNNSAVDGYHLSIQGRRERCRPAFTKLVGRDTTFDSFNCSTLRLLFLGRRQARRNRARLYVYVRIRAYNEDNNSRNGTADHGEWTDSISVQCRSSD